MEHYLHSLCRANIGDGSGWYAPIELPDSQQAVGYAIPVNECGRTFDSYIVEVGTYRKTTSPIWKVYHLTKVAKREFLLKLSAEEIRFTERRVYSHYRKLPYRGSLKHPDFAYFLIELQPEEPDQIDDLFENKRMFIIGCNPFANYDGIESIVEKIPVSEKAEALARKRVGSKRLKQIHPKRVEK